MADCGAAARRLRGLLDRVLSVAEREEIERHLAACADCRRTYEFEAGLARLRARSTGPATRPPVGQALVRRFTQISFALTLVATLLTIYAMGRVVDSYLLGQAALEEHRRLDRRLLPLVPAGGFDWPLAPAEQALLDAVVREHLLAPPVERVALRSATGALLFASSPASAEARREDLAAILAGDARSEVVPAPDGRRRLRLLRPLLREGIVVGVYEVEQDYEPLAAHIAEMQLFAGASMGAFSEEARRVGAAGSMGKPFSPLRLAERVADLAAGRGDRAAD